MADKMVKKDMFALLATYIPEDAEHAAELKEFCAKQIEQIEAKAEKARRNAAIRKAEGDELRDMVYGALTNELQTIPQIMDAMGLDDPEITRAKVSARLGQLFKAGEIEKTAISVDGKRTMHYKLAE